MVYGYDLFKDLFKPEFYADFEKFEQDIYRLGNVGFQINKSNNMLYNNIVIQGTETVIDKPQTVWESRLDSIVINKPALVINHDNNTKEIMVQDYNNKLYLISNSGREVWRINLDERITSEIYQIDKYKNGKLQYLFSTENQIHLIDRLGNYVDKYPVKLRASATAPISLFDYNKDKNYRIVIPCSDNMVYLYDADGDIVKGWEFESTENKVKSEIMHYAISGEDYIAFHDEYKAYFLNRKGESRNEFLTSFTFSNNRIYFDYSYPTPRFVATDNTGCLRYFYPDGRQDSLKLGDFSESHFFALRDIDADGKSDYVFLDQKKLVVYNRNEKQIFTYSLESEADFEPVFYAFPRNQIKIGIVCSEVNKIFLINSDGTLFEGFPLFGVTPFSIGYLSSETNKFNLIVGGKANLLYNYEVNEN
jgi:WD40 repeat protein